MVGVVRVLIILAIVKSVPAFSAGKNSQLSCSLLTRMPTNKQFQKIRPKLYDRTVDIEDNKASIAVPNIDDKQKLGKLWQLYAYVTYLAKYTNGVLSAHVTLVENQTNKTFGAFSRGSSVVATYGHDLLHIFIHRLIKPIVPKNVKVSDYKSLAIRCNIQKK